MIWAALKRSALALLLFMLPLMYFLPNTNFSATQLAFAMAGISVLLLLWALGALWQPAIGLNLTALFAPFLLLLLAMTLSLINSLNVPLSVQFIVFAVYYFALFLFVANHVEHPSDAHFVLGCLALATFVVAGYGLLQYAGLLPGHPNPRVPSERILATLGNKNFVGELLAAVFYPALVLLLLWDHMAVKLVMLSGLALVTVTLMAVDSDAAWLALAAGSLCFWVGVVVLRLTAPLNRNRAWLLSLLGMATLGWLLLAAPAAWNTLAGVAQTQDEADKPLPAAGLSHLSGDWDGDGRTDLAQYRQEKFHWDLDGDGQPDLSLPWGQPGDRPVIGDWNGDGLADHGVFRPSESAFYLETAPGEPPLAVQAAWSTPQDWPLAGDWNGDGKDEVGVYRPDEGLMWLDERGDGRVALKVQFDEHQPGDLPVVARQAGISALGLFRPATQTFYWDDTLDGRVDRIQRRRAQTWPERVYGWLKPSLIIRLLNWTIGWEMLKEHPVVGVGLANYELQFLPQKAKVLKTTWGRRLEAVEQDPQVGYIPRAVNAHNEVVQVGAEMGLVGLISLGFLLFRLVRYGSRPLRRSSGAHTPARLLALGVWAGLAAQFVDALLGFPLHLPATALLWMALTGVLFSRYLQPRMPAVVVQGRRRWVLALTVLAVCVMVGVATARAFVGDLKVQEAVGFYSQGFDHLGAREMERSLAWEVVPNISLQYIADYYARWHDTRGAANCIDYNQRALRAQPSERAYWDLGRCYLAFGQLEAAAEHLRTLAAIDPAPQLKQSLMQLMDTRYEHYLAAWETGDRTASLQGLDALAKIAEQGLDWTKETELSLRRAELRIESGMGGGKEAGIGLLRALIGAHPDFVPAYISLGQALADTEEGQRHLRGAMIRIQRRQLLLQSAPVASDPAERASLVLMLDQLEQWKHQIEKAWAQQP